MTHFLLDTNILINAILDEGLRDKKQINYSRNLIKKCLNNPKYKAYVSLIVIHEYLYIMKNYYKSKGDDYIESLIKVIGIKNVNVVETTKNEVLEILALYKFYKKLDFTDVYLIYKSQKNKWNLETFDKGILEVID